MNKRTLARGLLCAIPLLIAAPVAVYLNQSEYDDSVLQIRLALDTATLAVGATLSVLAILTLCLIRRTTRRSKLALDAQREQARLEHRRFTQRLDHELKNPLTAIRLSVENLRMQNEDRSLHADIESIETQSQRLVRLTGDLRKVGVFDKQALDLEEVNVSELLRELDEMSKETGLFVENDRVLQIVTPSAPWPVPNIKADRDLLQLALYNLLDNAVKYSSKGDTVELHASEDGHNVRIVIADTGLGINPTDVDHIWDELYRGRNARDQLGSGIGLSLVKRIIDRHGGEILVDSKENTGTRVAILLPISQP